MSKTMVAVMLLVWCVTFAREAWTYKQAARMRALARGRVLRVKIGPARSRFRHMRSIAQIGGVS